jgi:hypothetical protein
LREASEAKSAAVAKAGVTAPDDTGALIDALATITARLQSESADNRHLRSTERGIFTLPLQPTLTPEQEDLLRVIGEAAEAGFFRIVERARHQIRFRIHASLAAKYEFSYRGAYYDFPLSWRNVLSLRAAVRDDKLGQGGLKRVLERLENDQSENLSLFEQS